MLSSSEKYVPDGLEFKQALERTYAMGICAHQDDLEIAAIEGILNCFGREDRWFAGVIVTNGSGSPRDGLYKDYTDEQMQKVRILEQKKAAMVGEFGSLTLLSHSSSSVKDPKNREVVNDIIELLTIAKPEIIYTHNLADKHDTHIGVALKTIAALRELPAEIKPKKVLGCEVWRDLDWMTDSDKHVMDVSERENIASSLVGIFDSQIAGGKRYDLATMGRRRAHATYFASHGVDNASQITFGMDMTPLIWDNSINPLDYVQSYIKRFSDEVAERVARMLE